MNSTGNDIVSLKAINVTRTQQPEFYSKILSGSESPLFYQPGFAAIPLEHFVWLLWSIKEAAYKFIKRVEPELIFTPVKIEIKQLQSPAAFAPVKFEPVQMRGTGFEGLPAFEGTIGIGEHRLYSRSLLFNELIMSVVNFSEDFKDTHWGIRAIESCRHEAQSASVRAFLLDELQNNTGLDAIVINKTGHGVPFLCQNQTEINIPVSLSHHDYFVAYSFQRGK